MLGERPPWDHYFMEIAHVVGTRSTCDRGKTGSVITRNNHILVTGYAGAPRGLAHCDEIGHQLKTVIHEDGRETQHCLRTAHAEQNALIQAARIGISVEDSTVYCSMTPCSACAKMLINAGVNRIVCAKRYHAGEESEEMFRKVGVELIFFEEGIQKYEKQ